MAPSYWIGHSVKCLLIVSLCVDFSGGFSVSRDGADPGTSGSDEHIHTRHHRQHHHGHRQHRHGQDVDRKDVEVSIPTDSLGVKTLAEAALGDLQDLEDEDDPASVPVFMKMLLWETEGGFLFRDRPSSRQAGNQQLATCISPSRVNVDPAGAIDLAFSSGHSPGRVFAGTWLVLALQQDSEDDIGERTVTLYEIAPQHPGSSDAARTGDRRLLHQKVLPNNGAGFIALDVSESVLRSPRPRFLVDVTSEGKDHVGAASVLEVAGRERGPLLVHAKETLTEGAPVYIWKEPHPELDLPPTLRDRRHTRHHLTTTAPPSTTASTPISASTEIPASVENIVRQGAFAAAQSEASPVTTESPADEPSATCHLVPWEMSTQDLGWSFVLFPKILPINLCVGRCPSDLLDRRFNATTNALARSLYKLHGNGSSLHIPEPKCVPIRYKKLALLIQSANGGISLETNNDLCADRCGCR